MGRFAGCRRLILNNTSDYKSERYDHVAVVVGIVICGHID